PRRAEPAALVDARPHDLRRRRAPRPSRPRPATRSAMARVRRPRVLPAPLPPDRAGVRLVHAGDGARPMTGDGVPQSASVRRQLDEDIVGLVLSFCRRFAEVGGLARSLLGEEMPRLGLEPADRRAVAAGFYRVLRLRRRIEFALQHAGAALADRDVDRAAYFAALVLDGCIAPEAAAERARLGRERIDFRAVAGIDAVIAAEPDPVRRFGLTHSVPDWLAERFLAEFGSEADAVVRGLNGWPPLTVRANTLHVTREALAEEFHALGCRTEPTRHAPHG